MPFETLQLYMALGTSPGRVLEHVKLFARGLLLWIASGHHVSIEPEITDGSGRCPDLSAYDPQNAPPFEPSFSEITRCLYPAGRVRGP